MGHLPAETARPHVQIACVCEKVLIESDNVPSLIRVVDTYTLAMPSQELVPPHIMMGVDLIAFVSLKSGDVVGEFEVGLRLNLPDNSDRPIRKWRTDFKGGEAGVNLKIAFTLPNPALGMYWFDVLWGDDILTRIPFRLKASDPPPTDVSAVSTESVTSR